EHLERITVLEPTWWTEGKYESSDSIADEKLQLSAHDFGIKYEAIEPYPDRQGIRTPKSIKSALVLAISGHALWNGSSYASFVIPKYLGLGDSESALIGLFWTVTLILSILAVARSLMTGIKSLEN
ncbi:MAG TPA: hypothetical protein QF703_04160, partial [Candidatus Thalassarchaeaceae archaeon]|nr:hypothetical protein [Candidatus Thalassarchaeaceae archaeon]